MSVLRHLPRDLRREHPQCLLPALQRERHLRLHLRLDERRRSHLLVRKCSELRSGHVWRADIY